MKAEKRADEGTQADTGAKAVKKEEKKLSDTRFTKEQLKEAKQFAGCEDILEALLDAKKCYTKQETMQLMEQFRKGDRKVC